MVHREIDLAVLTKEVQVQVWDACGQILCLLPCALPFLPLMLCHDRFYHGAG